MSRIIPKPSGDGFVVVGGLEDDVGVGLQELHHRTVGELPFLVQPVHDPIMHVGRAALVHQLCLRLRIEILRDLPHDAQHLPLPRP